MFILKILFHKPHIYISLNHKILQHLSTGWARIYAPFLDRQRGTSKYVIIKHTHYNWEEEYTGTQVSRQDI